MKKLIHTITLIFLITSAFSQSCLPEGITFTTQAQIDSFQINYPNCTEIEGNVMIQGEDISSLNGLISLITIGGDLIMYNTSLTTMSGLDNLLYVGGDVAIGEPTTADWPEGNPLLGDLSGLEALDSIGGNLHINGSSLLSDLSGLEGLILVGGHFYIFVSPLPNLMGLENLISIGGGIYFAGSSINDLSPLSNLNSSLSFISIHRTLLVNLVGLEGVSSIDEIDLIIRDNDSLISLAGLVNITSISGSLQIIGNNSLNSLEGLDNIEASSIEGLVVSNNSNLSNCEIESVCAYLASPNGTIEIFDNAIGCNSPEEVLDSCEAHAGIIDVSPMVDGILIYPNPTKSSITIELSTQPSKNASLTLTNTNDQQLITKFITKPQTEIDISHLPVGIYIVKVWNDKDVMVQKVIKQ